MNGRQRVAVIALWDLYGNVDLTASTTDAVTWAIERAITQVGDAAGVDVVEGVSYVETVVQAALA